MLGTIAKLERYDDQAAFDAHRVALHFLALPPKMFDCLASKPELQMMQEV
jgi:quinol monooxygenase YgiN